MGLPKYRGTTQDLGRKGQLMPANLRHKGQASAALGGLVPQPWGSSHSGEPSKVLCRSFFFKKAKFIHCYCVCMHT